MGMLMIKAQSDKKAMRKAKELAAKMNVEIVDINTVANKRTGRYYMNYRYLDKLSAEMDF